MKIILVNFVLALFFLILPTNCIHISSFIKNQFNDNLSFLQKTGGGTADDASSPPAASSGSPPASSSSPASSPSSASPASPGSQASSGGTPAANGGPPADPNGKIEQKRNNTIQVGFDYLLNTTAHNLNDQQFASKFANWDFKLHERELDEVWGAVLRNEGKITNERGLRAFLNIFVEHFTACNKKENNVLTIGEFSECMANEPFLKKIKAPPKKYIFVPPNQNQPEFNANLFFLLDTHLEKVLNFKQYLYLRLVIYSLQKCSPISPEISEVTFHCAINISSGYRTLQPNTTRSLFELALQLGNNEDLRNLDFLTFFQLSQTVRLYSDINRNLQTDLSYPEMINALSNNILPKRYNKNTVNQLFQLLSSDQIKTGNNQRLLTLKIDIYTFYFQDFFLRLFSRPGAAKPFLLNRDEFLMTLYHPMFPKSFVSILEKVPMIEVLTKVANANQFMWHNITNFNNEESFFGSYLQLKSHSKQNATDTDKVIQGTQYKPVNETFKQYIEPTNYFYNITLVGDRSFTVLDAQENKAINFETFMWFIEHLWLFSKTDTSGQGRVISSRLLDFYSNFGELPRISWELKVAVQDLANYQDVYVDSFHMLGILRAHKILSVWLKDRQNKQLKEPELKHILNMLSLSHIPEVYLDKCMKGLIENIPYYDPDCALTQSFTKTLKFWDEGYQILLIDKMEKEKEGEQKEGEQKDKPKKEDIYGAILKNTRVMNLYKPLIDAAKKKEETDKKAKEEFEKKKQEKETKK